MRLDGLAVIFKRQLHRMSEGDCTDATKAFHAGLKIVCLWQAWCLRRLSRCSDNASQIADFWRREPYDGGAVLIRGVSKMWFSVIHRSNISICFWSAGFSPENTTTSLSSQKPTRMATLPAFSFSAMETMSWGRWDCRRSPISAPALHLERWCADSWKSCGCP